MPRRHRPHPDDITPTTSVTRDTYTSVADEAKHAAADAISAFLSAADSTRKRPRPLPKLELPIADRLYATAESSAYTRRINLDPRVEAQSGTGWELAAERERAGAWHVLRSGEVVGVIERRTTSTGANTLGWHATRRGVDVTIGANGAGLYRSRDLAAAAVIHVETAVPDNVRSLRPA